MSERGEVLLEYLGGLETFRESNESTNHCQALKEKITMFKITTGAMINVSKTSLMI